MSHHNPATKPSIGRHHDGCSDSVGREAIPGSVKINGRWPFRSGDPWGFHIKKTKHCKHHIHVASGMFNIKCDRLPIAATDFPGLSCGIPDFSLDFDVELRP